MTEAPSFADFVQQTREKKKKEALAQEILGSRGRKPNGAGAIPKSTTQKPSLMSRMSSGSGVTKSRSSSAKPTGNIEGKWQHDLHKVNNPNGPPSKNLNRTASASQVDRNTRTFNKFQSIVRNNAPPPEPSGFSIKGIAAGGPYTVIASNFAPGTTAADIEAAMLPHATEGGGELLSCRLITSTPTVMVEMQVDRMESADNIISIFNNKKADGRLLYVYLKETPNSASAHKRPLPRGGQSSFDDMDIDRSSGARSGSFQDGRFGFDNNTRREPPRGPRRRY